MGVILLAGYYGLILFLAFYRGQGRGLAAFCVNDRQSSAPGVAFSILVSCVGASATMGVVGLAYSAGTPALWWLGSGALGLLAGALLLARRVRESRAHTMPQLVETYLGRPARTLLSVIIVVAWTAILAAQFSALSTALGSLTGFGTEICLGLSFVFIVTHTLGGQAAIMRVDGLQTLILLGGLGLLLFWLSLHNPGWTATVTPQAVNADFPPGRLIYFLLILGGGYLVCPMLFGRMLSARSAASARVGSLLAVGLLLAAAGIIVAVGLASQGLVAPGSAPDSVLTSVMETVLPPWLRLIMLLALAGAVISSADSCLVTSGTILSLDLLGLKSLAACRCCVIFLGLAGAAVASLERGILEYLLMANDVYVSGAVIPVFLGLMLGREHRPHPLMAGAAVSLGGLLGGIAAATGNPVFSYAGMGTSALITLLGVPMRAVPRTARPAGTARV